MGTLTTCETTSSYLTGAKRVELLSSHRYESVLRMQKSMAGEECAKQYRSASSYYYQGFNCWDYNWFGFSFSGLIEGMFVL
jgi:hypothetical protein